MYFLNKFVWFCFNPLMFGMVLLALGIFWTVRNRKRYALGALGAAFAWFWFCSTLTASALLGLPLESRYAAAARVQDIPTADAVVLLGGGMSKSRKIPYPEMLDGADRVWHAARLWKAGKAPLIVASGSNSLESTVPLLHDFGIPDTAICVDDTSRNTRENAQFTERLLANKLPDNKSVLLVTSAWHMPRAVGNFSHTSLKVYPAATDFVTTTLVDNAAWWDFILPKPGRFDVTCTLFKEWVGRFARK